MKHGKKPNLKQKKYISNLKWRGIKLNPDHWLVVKDTAEKLYIVKKEGAKSLRVWNKTENCWIE